MSSLAVPTSAADDTIAPQAPARPDWVPKALFPFTSRYVEVSGGRIRSIFIQQDPEKQSGMGPLRFDA